MSVRNYNIYFHLHTVSGIVISVGLYVIFFAGAFTLFNHESVVWEDTSVIHERLKPGEQPDIKFDHLLSVLKLKGYDLQGRDVGMSISGDEVLKSVYISGSPDSLATPEERKYERLWYNSRTKDLASVQSNEFSIGLLLDDLHYFWQLGGNPGYYLAGLVTLFFLFAIVSGIIVHWKKIVSNFFVFRPAQKLKTVWTDAHTALGVIGIPLQFMYALTGAMFGLGILVETSGSWLYGNDREKFFGELYGAHSEGFDEVVDMADYNLHPYVDRIKTVWSGFEPSYLFLSKYGTSSMQLAIYGGVGSKDRFYNAGEMVYDVVTDTVNHQHSPFDRGFHEVVWPTVDRLHFAEFDLPIGAHYTVKILYFLLCLATLFVIVTGVLIWLEARNKKHIPEKNRRFNRGVGYIYLAVCLSMLPVTALSLIVSKVLPVSQVGNKEGVLNSVFFGGWFLLSVFFWSKKDIYFTNKYSLFSTGILGLLIPFANGIISGNWFWLSLSRRYHELFVMDILWIGIAAIALFVVWRLKKTSPGRSLVVRGKRMDVKEKVYST